MDSRVSEDLPAARANVVVLDRMANVVRPDRWERRARLDRSGCLG